MVRPLTKKLKRQRDAGAMQASQVSLTDGKTELSLLESRGVDSATMRKQMVSTAIKMKKEMLPHLYSRKWYQWAWDFFTTTQRVALLTAGNQLSKSSTQIRKCIEWACNKDLWPELWPDNPNPKIFWYMYPSNAVATTEFEKKWLLEWMPRGDMKNHAWYGWDAQYSDGEIDSISFNSGVTVYFKSYSQKTANLQTATLFAVFTDEEMPVHHIDEILARLRGTRGYFSMVFTATLGQQLWYNAMECIGKPDEAFKSAWKRSVSMYDSMYYMDGSASQWTAERIKEEEMMCTSQAERDKRIMGRFIQDGGVQYSSFVPDVNVIDPIPIPANYQRYAAVDLGTNKTAQRSKGAIIYIAVNEEMTHAYVYCCWRGDDAPTTAGDILDKYVELRGSDSMNAAAYDYGAGDFGVIASRRGEPFFTAKKDRKIGVKRTNTLFQCRALSIFRNTESHKLIGELMTVPSGEKVRNGIDDLTDALRYCIMLIPFDWSKISPTFKDESTESGEPKQFTSDELKALDLTERRKRARVQYREPSGYVDNLQSEVEAWNEAYGNS